MRELARLLAAGDDLQVRVRMWLPKVARGYRALLNSILLLAPSSAAHRPHSLFLAVHLPTLNWLAMSSSDDNALVAYVATMWVSHPRLILLSQLCKQYAI